MKSIVLGLGNMVFGDEGVGLRVIKELQQQNHDKNITLEGWEVAGLNMLEKLSGFDRVIVIDAIRNRGKAGEIRVISPREMIPTLHTGAPHDFNFITGQIYGERIGVYLPDKLDIVAIEIPERITFGEELTAEVAKAVPKAVALIREILGE
jgi:hydrogenase maturation protease